MSKKAAELRGVRFLTCDNVCLRVLATGSALLNQSPCQRATTGAIRTLWDHRARPNGWATASAAGSINRDVQTIDALAAVVRVKPERLIRW